MTEDSETKMLSHFSWCYHKVICIVFKGISVVYYGEEIGMVDADISYEDTMDPWGCNCGPINYVNCSRDPARTPMQWSENRNAGFSHVRPHKP